ncbi:MAG TPA: hypothetical protein VF613_06785 [Longimicrobium sp.]
MSEATVESQRPAFRWWGERVRIVIVAERRAPRAGMRLDPDDQGPPARQACEVAG